MMTKLMPTNSELKEFPHSEDSKHVAMEIQDTAAPDKIVNQEKQPNNRKVSADLSVTSGSTDGSEGNASLSDSKNSTEVWVQTCEEEQQGNDADMEISRHSQIDVCEEMIQTGNAERVDQSHNSSSEEVQTDDVQKTVEDHQQQDEQAVTAVTSVDDAEEGECSVVQAAQYDDDSTTLNSNSTGFQKASKESRISSVTFSAPSTPQTSSEFLEPTKSKTNKEPRVSSVSFNLPTPETSSEFLKASGNTVVSPEPTTSSQRWTDITKELDPPTPVSRKISIIPKGDSAPMIPSRVSLDIAPSDYAEVPAPLWPKNSILKTPVEEEIPVKVNRRYWKKLPPPDMDTIKEKRQELLDFLQSQDDREDDAAASSPCPPTAGAFHNRSLSEGDGDNAVPVPLAPLRERSKSEGGKANVNFEMIYIREYQQTIGDNPSVSYGTAVSLDWPYVDNEPLDFDLYEATKKPRRTMRQMYLNYYQRKNLLIHRYGHSEAEVKAAKRATKKVKNQREISKIMQTSLKPLLVVEEMRESAVRKAKRRMSNTNTVGDATELVAAA